MDNGESGEDGEDGEDGDVGDGNGDSGGEEGEGGAYGSWSEPALTGRPLVLAPLAVTRGLTLMLLIVLCTEDEETGGLEVECTEADAMAMATDTLSPSLVVRV